MIILQKNCCERKHLTCSQIFVFYVGPGVDLLLIGVAYVQRSNPYEKWKVKKGKGGKARYWCNFARQNAQISDNIPT